MMPTRNESTAVGSMVITMNERYQHYNGIHMKLIESIVSGDRASFSGSAFDSLFRFLKKFSQDRKPRLPVQHDHPSHNHLVIFESLQCGMRPSIAGRLLHSAFMHIVPFHDLSATQLQVSNMLQVTSQCVVVELNVLEGTGIQKKKRHQTLPEEPTKATEGTSQCVAV
jgi:hypothetical protein